jgi:hypothetical protein
MTSNQQLELGLNGGRMRHAGTRSEQRAVRAAWWFARMRQAVDNAFDWQPVPEPRAEQTEIPGTHREIQVCE